MAQVSVTPSSVVLNAAGTQQFTASGQNCLWSTPIGTVNLAGVYQAPLNIPFSIQTTVTATCGGQSGMATVTLNPSALPVAGLEYIRGGAYAGVVIVLAIQPPLWASNGQVGINGSTIRCDSSHACFGIITMSNPDGTVSPGFNSAVVATRSLVVSAQDLICVDSTSTVNGQCSTPSPAAWGGQYSPWQSVLYVPSASSLTSASLNVNNLGSRSIKLHDGTTDPGNLLVEGTPYWLTMKPVGSGPLNWVWVMTQGDSHQ